MQQRLTAILCATLLLCGCGEATPSGEAGSDAISDGSGLPDGSAEGSEPCWQETGMGFCPARPVGVAAADCPGGLVEDAGFAPGTGICAPALAPWVCPDGWSEAPRFREGSGEPLPEALAGLKVCEPPAEPPTDCPDGTMPRPGSSTCVRMGVECPASGDRWHDEATLRALAPDFAGPIIYVSPDAPADGLGTRDQPRALSSAAVRAAENGILALSTGLHPVALRLDRHVALVGACVEQTTLSADQASETLGAIDVAANGSVLVSNLTVTGQRAGVWVRGSVAAPHRFEALSIRQTILYGMLFETPQAAELHNVRIRDVASRPSTRTLGRGLELQNGATVTAEGLSVASVREVGAVLSGSGSRLDATHLLIEKTLSRETDAAFGRGMTVNAGASLRLRDSIVRDNADVGVSLSGEGASLDAERLSILRTQPNARGILGRGLELKGGATALVRDSLLRENHEVALIVTDTGSHLEGERLLLDNTQPTPAANTYGLGLQCQTGASADLRNVAVTGSRKVGIEVIGRDATLRFSDLTIARTLPTSSVFETGGGLLVREAAQVEGEDLILAQNASVGTFVADPFSSLELLRLQVWNTLPRPEDSRFGHAVQAEGGGRFVGTHANLQGNSEVAMDASGTDSLLRARYLLVRDTVPRTTDGRAGRALELSAGAEGDFTDAIFRANTELAAFAAGPRTLLGATRLLVADTLPQPRSATLGHGLCIQDGAEANLQDLVVANNHGVGLIATGEDAKVALHRVVIRRTAPHPADNRFGIGLGIYNFAAVEGEDVALIENRRCALQLAGDQVTLSLERVRLSGSEVGTNLQVVGFTPELLQTSLRSEQYDGNGEDVAASVYEVPVPVAGLDAAPPP